MQLSSSIRTVLLSGHATPRMVGLFLDENGRSLDGIDRDESRPSHIFKYPNNRNHCIDKVMKDASGN